MLNADGPLGRYGVPFRVGATSFIYPEDILPNVRRLVDWMDDIQIVLYEVNPLSPLPAAATLGALQELALSHDITYTIHLPLDLTLASEDVETRRISVQTSRQVIQTMSCLRPWGYVVHAEPGAGVMGSWSGWQRRAEESLRYLMDEVDRPEQLCLENLESTPPEQVWALAERLGISVCFDVGHVFKAGLDATPYLDGRLDRARVIHLHGWDGKCDHLSLTVTPDELWAPLVRRLYEPLYRGVVTLEVFSESDLLTSWRCLVK